MDAIVVDKLFERRLKTSVMPSSLPVSERKLIDLAPVTVLSPAGTPLGRLRGVQVDTTR